MDDPVEILVNGGIDFKVGGHASNGNVEAHRGNKIEFFSTRPFAIFFKRYSEIPPPKAKFPFALRSRTGQKASPEEFGALVVCSELKTQKQRAFVKIHDRAPAGYYEYGVVATNSNGEIRQKDPQIIIQ